jgi:hypothetical protein
MKTLRERVAQEIDRASQEGYRDSLFDSDIDDPVIKKYKENLLVHADRIIKIVLSDSK